MGRKKGADMEKIAAIINVLARNQDGMWLRKLAKEAGISPMSASKYANTVLKPFLEDISLSGENRPILRIIRLKPFVIEKLREGKDLNQILKILNLVDKVS